MNDGDSSIANHGVLLHPGLVRWNEQTWNLTAHRREYLPEGRRNARLSAVLYVDRRGSLRQPRLDPYLALAFDSTAPTGSPQRERQWIELASQLAHDMRTLRLLGNANLQPDLMDARPFTEAGLSATVRYTYVGHLPHDQSMAESAVRKRASKASRGQYAFEASVTPEELATMLESTGARQGFSYGLNAQHIANLEKLIPPEYFRLHAVRDANGQVVSAGARLVAKDGVAIDWVQGTDPTALNDGVVQLMYAGVLQDMHEVGATRFDFGGANIPAVARAKSSWGMPLVPYVSLARPSLKHAALQFPALRHFAKRLRR